MDEIEAEGEDEKAGQPVTELSPMSLVFGAELQQEELPQPENPYDDA
jgi:hypothetical protein